MMPTQIQKVPLILYSSFLPFFSSSRPWRGGDGCVASPKHVPLRIRPLPRAQVGSSKAGSPCAAVATREGEEAPVAETSGSGSGFVEIGHISRVHGLQGEVCVKSRTDFPQLRFSKPGRRWLRFRVLGKETVREVELVEGRGESGQKSWILRFQGVDTVEKAKQLVGAAFLVEEDDRPELEEGEFYSRDLIGLRVILKETGESIGTVESVYNSGASDLLYVALDKSESVPSGIQKNEETEVPNQHVWVPFVEAIVPHVDIGRGEMVITPPKGLLELNLRTDHRSKKERRQLEWKDRKKLQKRLIAAKKKLCELEQQHVFHGLRYGEKNQRSLLADQILAVNSKLLQQALVNIEKSPEGWNPTTESSKMFDTTKTLGNGVTISRKEHDENSDLEKRGLDLMLQGKVAQVILMSYIDDQMAYDTDLHLKSLVEMLNGGNQILIKPEDRASVPLILTCPVGETQSFERIFSDNAHFGFDSGKIWILEEEMLPVISFPTEEQKRLILMKSPWEILQSPVGSGGIVSLFSSHNILEKLSEIGVDYIQISVPDARCMGGMPSLLGLVDSSEAGIGLQISETKESDPERSLSAVFSTTYMSELAKDFGKLKFYPYPIPNAHVQLINKEWVDVVPFSLNSFHIRSSLYWLLDDNSNSGKVCIVSD
ncbi:hypothetical protein MLD38_010322 [Melastoma candidum]|uniref:Uncharacterized protein n=1 Tax=Melastoma candidum TaxID=119954 RepID=A0ACB9R015_9MYRT|nr:hypothetical protein MLD38_010322 [Melastoma candidum]